MLFMLSMGCASNQEKVVTVTANQPNEPVKGQMQQRNKNPNDKRMYGEIVEKPYVLKNGVQSAVSELFFRASVQDYFIKFCESSVTRSQVAPYIGQGITLAANVQEGEWDKCPVDSLYEVQSRMGYYITIDSIY